MDLTRLLAPRSVAVVGATDRPGSYAAATLLNLRRAGFPGRVVGIHPTRTEVLGVRCVPILDDASRLFGEPPDAVVVAIPAAGVVPVLAAAGRLGCGGAVVYAAGFAEAGDRAAELELAAVARARGLPVLGPNGNGLVSVLARAPLWGDPVTLPDRPGPIALVTQSGNLGVLALAHRAGLGLHAVVSVGNAAVLDAADVLAHLARTAPAGLRAVALYLEGDGSGARLAGALAECARAELRVTVLKAGRSAAGRQAAGAHTAALAGDHRVFAALIAEAGGVLVRDLHELLETARALAALRRDPRPPVIVTASGGDAAIAADLAADAGLPLADPSPDAVAAVRSVLGPDAAVTNPLDHTNAVWADEAAIGAITHALASDPAAGPVVYVQDQPPGLPAADAAEWAASRAGAIAGATRAGSDLLLVATTPGQEPPHSSLPAISGLRPALAALAALRHPSPDPARLASIAHAASRRGNFHDHGQEEDGGARRSGAEAEAEGGGGGGGGGGAWLAEHEAKALLATAAIPTPPSQTLPATMESPPSTPAVIMETSVAARAAAELGYPVALKVSAPGLLHKSEAGLLELGIASEPELRAAVERLHRLARAMPGARLLIERMASPGVELVLAVRRDGVVPALVVGFGGIWAEALDDVAVIPLPADPDRVVAGLRSLRGAVMLTGGRGRAPVDLAAVGEIGYALGELADRERLDLIEINPLIVPSEGELSMITAGRGVVAVDALARRSAGRLS